MILKQRFRKKTTRLCAVVQAFRESERVSLHPDQVSRRLGISLQEAHRILEDTSELFVRLPRGPDRIRRFALAPSFSRLTPEQGKAYIVLQARKEAVTHWSVVLIYLVAGIALLVAALGYFGLDRGWG